MQPMTEPNQIRGKLCEAKVFEIKSQIAMMEIQGNSQMMAGIPGNLEFEQQLELQHSRIKMLENMAALDDDTAFATVKTSLQDWLAKPSLMTRLAFEIALFANRTSADNWMIELEQRVTVIEIAELKE